MYKVVTEYNKFVQCTLDFTTSKKEVFRKGFQQRQLSKFIMHLT